MTLVPEARSWSPRRISEARIGKASKANPTASTARQAGTEEHRPGVSLGGAQIRGDKERQVRQGEEEDRPQGRPRDAGQLPASDIGDPHPQQPLARRGPEEAVPHREVDQGDEVIDDDPDPGRRGDQEVEKKGRGRDDEGIGQIRPDPERDLRRRDVAGGERSEGLHELVEVFEAAIAVALQPLADHLVEPDGHLGPLLPRRGGRVTHDPGHRRRGVAPIERGPAGQEEEEGRRRRVDVGPDVERLDLDLLGRGVERRPQERPGPGQVARPDLRLRQAEVADLDPPLAVEEAVRRLDVAVDQAQPVGLAEPLDHVEDLAHGVADFERPALLDQVLERVAGHQLHGDERPAVVVLVGLEHENTSRVRQRTGQPPLLAEPLDGP